MLAEAIEELKAQREGKPKRIKPEITPSIGLPLTAHIPEEYVLSLNARLGLYHRLAKTESIKEIEDIAQELRDRFGGLPKAVENLLYMVKIKILATKAEIESIHTEERKIIIKPRRPGTLSLPTRYSGVVKVGPTQLRLDTRPLGDSWIEVLEEILTPEAEPSGVPLQA